jgi:hypothetical protein
MRAHVKSDADSHTVSADVRMGWSCCVVPLEQPNICSVDIYGADVNKHWAGSDIMLTSYWSRARQVLLSSVHDVYFVCRRDRSHIELILKRYRLILNCACPCLALLLVSVYFCCMCLDQVAMRRACGKHRDRISNTEFWRGKRALERPRRRWSEERRWMHLPQDSGSLLRLGFC